MRDGLIAASGPLDSLAIGLACALVATASYGGSIEVYVRPTPSPGPTSSSPSTTRFPGLPLDGAQRAARDRVGRHEGRAPRHGRRRLGGRVVAVLVMSIPVLDGVVPRRRPTSSASSSAWPSASFIWQGASQALKSAAINARVPRLSARALSRPAIVVLGDTPLAEALRRAEAESATGLVVVDSAGHLVAIANPAAIDAVPVERRPWVPVSSVSSAFDPRAAIPAELTGNDLLHALLSVPSDNLPSWWSCPATASGSSPPPTSRPRSATTEPRPGAPYADAYPC
ncbi:MAG: CBS domain-containing protein [Candidatus Nanopelagicales bacterium]